MKCDGNCGEDCKCKNCNCKNEKLWVCKFHGEK